MLENRASVQKASAPDKIATSDNSYKRVLPKICTDHSRYGLIDYVRLSSEKTLHSSTDALLTKDLKNRFSDGFHFNDNDLHVVHKWKP
jgi:hypothetical protein